MPQVINTAYFSLNAAGATFTIYDTDSFAEYVISGSAALASNNSVVFSGTPILNMNVKVRYEGTATNAGGSVVIFGTAFNSTQLALPQLVDCNYNGASWDVQISPDFSVGGQVNTADIAAGAVTASKLASNAVETAKINAAAVTYAKIQNVTDARMLGNNSGSAGAVQEMTKGDVLSFIGYVAPKETLAVPVSFESGLQCNNNIKLGFACSLSQTYVYGIATSAIAATDDAVVTIAKNGAPIAGATITFAGSSAINTAGSVGTFTTTNFAAGDTISFIGSKTTAGGSALVSCTLTLI